MLPGKSWGTHVRSHTALGKVNQCYALRAPIVPVKFFISHAWAEGFKEFCAALMSSSLDGGLWVCFFANPQTWEREQLDSLLGANPRQSPFALALREAEAVGAGNNISTTNHKRQINPLKNVTPSVHLPHI